MTYKVIKVEYYRMNGSSCIIGSGYFSYQKGFRIGNYIGIGFSNYSWKIDHFNILFLENMTDIFWWFYFTFRWMWLIFETIESNAA